MSSSVQPDTKPDAQYAIVINVTKEQCTDETFDIVTVFSREEAATVKTTILSGSTCVLCTNSQNVIATRPKSKKIHAEVDLLYPQRAPQRESPMHTLLEKANQDSCIVFYTYNSPCVHKCISGANNILNGLSNWKNKHKENNVFVFQSIWRKDTWRQKTLADEFQKINKIVPLYRCYGIDMICYKCEDNGQWNNHCLPGVF